MNIIRTATGTELMTDYLSAIPNPKVVFFRVLNSDLLSVAEIVSNPAQMASLEYTNYLIIGCTMTSLTVEGDAIKVSATYTEIRENSNG